MRLQVDTAVSQVDELYKICGVLGSPTTATWPEGLQLAQQMGFTFPSFAPIPLRQLVPSASSDAIDLMTRLCHWNPARRLTAAEALQHAFFQVWPPAPRLQSLVGVCLCAAWHAAGFSLRTYQDIALVMSNNSQRVLMCHCLQPLLAARAPLGAFMEKPARAATAQSGDGKDWKLTAQVNQLVWICCTNGQQAVTCGDTQELSNFLWAAAGHHSRCTWHADYCSLAGCKRSHPWCQQSMSSAGDRDTHAQCSRRTCTEEAGPPQQDAYRFPAGEPAPKMLADRPHSLQRCIYACRRCCAVLCCALLACCRCMSKARAGVHSCLHVQYQRLRLTSHKRCRLGSLITRELHHSPSCRRQCLEGAGTPAAEAAACNTGPGPWSWTYARHLGCHRAGATCGAFIAKWPQDSADWPSSSMATPAGRSLH